MLERLSLVGVCDQFLRHFLTVHLSEVEGILGWRDDRYDVLDFLGVVGWKQWGCDLWVLVGFGWLKMEELVLVVGKIGC